MCIGPRAILRWRADRYGVQTTYFDPSIGMAIENCSSPVPAPCCWKRRVRNPSRCRLETDPGHPIWKRDFSGASGLFSIALKPKPQAAVDALLDNLKLFGMAIPRVWPFRSTARTTDPPPNGRRRDRQCDFISGLKMSTTSRPIWSGALRPSTPRRSGTNRHPRSAGLARLSFNKRIDPPSFVDSLRVRFMSGRGNPWEVWFFST
jgi:hypothetical protein